MIAGTALSMMPMMHRGIQEGTLQATGAFAIGFLMFGVRYEAFI